MTPEISTYFELTGIGSDPDEVTNYVGITPTKTWRQGELVPKTALRRKYDGWSLQVGPEEAWNFDKQLRSLIDQLAPYIGKINEICEKRKLKASITCQALVQDRAPDVYFNPGVLRQAAALNADIDVDIMVLGPEEDEQNLAG